MIFNSSLNQWCIFGSFLTVIFSQYFQTQFVRAVATLLCHYKSWQWQRRVACHRNYSISWSFYSSIKSKTFLLEYVPLIRDIPIEIFWKIINNTQILTSRSWFGKDQSINHAHLIKTWPFKFTIKFSTSFVLNLIFFARLQYYRKKHNLLH